jgi:hypothetical protein
MTKSDNRCKDSTRSAGLELGEQVKSDLAANPMP